MYEIFYNMFGLNAKLFVTINKLTNISFLPVIFQFLSIIFFITNFALIYGCYCLYYLYQLKKSPNKIAYFDSIYYKLIKNGLLYIIFILLFTLLKFSVNFPRPFCSLPSEYFTTIIDISRERCLSSFPSAHIGLATLVGYIIWPYLHFIGKILYSFLFIAIGIARITLAMHYPADLIYGILIAIFVIKSGNYLFLLLKNNLISLLRSKIINYL